MSRPFGSPEMPDFIEAEMPQKAPQERPAESLELLHLTPEFRFEGKTFPMGSVFDPHEDIRLEQEIGDE